jgi:DNA-binding transcriptional ArsR family regulator
VHAFEVLADPVRRRILELLCEGEQTSGAVTDTIRAEFTISQPAVSQHLKVLRDNGFATVRAEGTRRVYAVELTGLAQVDQWLDRFRTGPMAAFWHQRLDALSTELARGRRAARQRPAETTVRTQKETA